MLENAESLPLDNAQFGHRFSRRMRNSLCFVLDKLVVHGATMMVGLSGFCPRKVSFASTPASGHPATSPEARAGPWILARTR